MKTKFNIVDVIILVVILAVIAAGCFVYINMKNNGQQSASNVNTAKLSFTIEVTNLSEDAANFFVGSEEQAVTFGNTSSGSGIIKKIEIVPYEKQTKNYEDGEYYLAEVPGQYNVKVTIESDVVKSSTSYKSGDEVIAVGKQMPFNSNGIASEDGYVVDLSEIK